MGDFYYIFYSSNRILLSTLPLRSHTYIGNLIPLLYTARIKPFHGFLVKLKISPPGQRISYTQTFGSKFPFSPETAGDSSLSFSSKKKKRKGSYIFISSFKPIICDSTFSPQHHLLASTRCSNTPNIYHIYCFILVAALCPRIKRKINRDQKKKK